jgi:tRNA-splicing ligase RtcB
MYGIITTEKKPIKLWLSDANKGTLEQAQNLANHPCTYSHVALMPDSHTGYGMPIGGVLATQNAIIPNAVGVDIGCGMCSLKTSLTEISRSSLMAILASVKSIIPRGHKWHKHSQGDWLSTKEQRKLHNTIVEREYKNSLQQLGTLGGGNHFIEIQKGSDGHIWIMIHSGSRNLGKTVAEHHNHKAIDLNKKYKQGIPKRWQLDYLPLNSEESQIYLKEMQVCIDFAFLNRKKMMAWVKEAFLYQLESSKSVSFSTFINIPHNYAALETHFGQDVWVHRKGATLASKGLLGIIPGSQGTKSYIVEGLGNADSFESCSHGAGRKMGRREAKRKLNLNEEIAFMNAKGIIHEITSTRDLDEAANAYKDIDQVMKNQKDLVRIVWEMNPLAVIKG